MPSSSPKGAKAAPKKITPRTVALTKAEPKALKAKTQDAKLQQAKAPGLEAPPPKAPSLKLKPAKAPSPKAHAFLVGVKRRREALRVYAVLTPSEAVALAIVEAASGEDVTVEPVGRLSKKLARPLKLLTGEPRLI